MFATSQANFFPSCRCWVWLGFAKVPSRCLLWCQCMTELHLLSMLINLQGNSSVEIKLLNLLSSPAEVSVANTQLKSGYGKQILWIICFLTMLLPRSSIVVCLEECLGVWAVVGVRRHSVWQYYHHWWEESCRRLGAADLGRQTWTGARRNGICCELLIHSWVCTDLNMVLLS